METILHEVKSEVSQWKTVAQEIGITRQEQQLMAAAFRF